MSFLRRQESKFIIVSDLSAVPSEAPLAKSEALAKTQAKNLTTNEHELNHPAKAESDLMLNVTAQRPGCTSDLIQ